YFENLKGHFGGCSNDYKRGVYDGTKKGSACGGWRLISKWIGEPFQPSTPPKSLTRRVAIVMKNPDRFDRSSSWLGSMFGPTGSKEFLALQKRLRDKGLLFARNGKRPKKYPADIVQRAASLYREGMSLRGISLTLSIGMGTAFRWVKAAGVKPHPLGSKATPARRRIIRRAGIAHRAKVLPNCKCVYHKQKSKSAPADERKESE